MALIDEAGRGGGIGQTRTGHDQRSRVIEAPAGEISVWRGSQNRPEFPREREPVEACDGFEVG
jgi:hypothetical protein